MSQDGKNDSMKSILDALGTVSGSDPLNLSEEELAVAMKLIAKIAGPKDIVRQGLTRITGEMISLLLDTACERDDNSGTLDLVKQTTSTLFQAWIEEEGEERVGPVLGLFHSTFDERYKGSPAHLIQRGKDVIMWLIEDLDLKSYATDNPLSASPSSDDECGPF